MGGSQHQKLGESLLVEVGQEIHIKVGEKVVLEADAEMTVKAGGSFVNVAPGGITMVGPAIKLNTGDSPGKGSGWAGKLPSLPGGVANESAPDVVELIAAIPTEQTVAAQVTELTPDAFYLFSE